MISFKHKHDSSRSSLIFRAGAFLLLFLCFLSTAELFGQSQLRVDDPLSLYYRINVKSVDNMPSFNLLPMQILTDSIMARNMNYNHPWKAQATVNAKSIFLTRSFNTTQSESDHVKFSLLTPVIRITHNNNFPWGLNDGSLWQGKGVNHYYRTGIKINYKKLTASFEPEFTYVQNIYSLLAPHRPPSNINRRGYPVMYIDLPQRFGRLVDEVRPEKDEYSTFYPGFTTINYSLDTYSIGFSTGQMWLGPAIINPLLMSNHGPGFAHAYIRSNAPMKIPTGHLEANWFWGTLHESLFFDNDSDYSKRFISGITLNYSPDFFKGFHLGVNRVAYKYFPDMGLTLSDLVLPLRRIASPPTKSHADMNLNTHWITMTSYFLRHVMPNSNFEWYLEWGQNSYSRDTRDWLTEPMLNRAYTVGVLKNFNLDSNHSIMGLLELTQLENNDPGAYNRQRDGTGNVNIWYASDVIRQGYTHKGEILGAGIGPGASSQTLKLRWYNPWGYLGTTINRTVYNNDRLFANIDYYLGKDDYRNGLARFMEVERGYELNLLVFLPFGAELQFDYRYADRLRYMNTKNLDINNTNLSFTLRYSLREIALN